MVLSSEGPDSTGEGAVSSVASSTDIGGAGCIDSCMSVSDAVTVDVTPIPPHISSSIPVCSPDDQLSSPEGNARWGSNFVNGRERVELDTPLCVMRCSTNKDLVLPLLQLQLNDKGGNGRVDEITALVDTGAQVTTISSEVYRLAKQHGYIARRCKRVLRGMDEHVIWANREVKLCLTPMFRDDWLSEEELDSSVDDLVVKGAHKWISCVVVDSGHDIILSNRDALAVFDIAPRLADWSKSVFHCQDNEYEMLSVAALGKTWSRSNGAMARDCGLGTEREVLFDMGSATNAEEVAEALEEEALELDNLCASFSLQQLRCLSMQSVGDDRATFDKHKEHTDKCDEYAFYNRVMDSKELLGAGEDKIDEMEELDPFLSTSDSNVLPAMDKLPPSLQSVMAGVFEDTKEVFTGRIHPEGADVPQLKLLKKSEEVLRMRNQQRRFSEPLRDMIDEKVDELIKNDIVEVATEEEYASEVVMVKQKEKYRLAFDYIRVNSTLKALQFPLPFIWDILEMLKGKRFIAKLDLRSGYHQFVIDEDSRSLTTFRTSKGVYRFKRIPFGLKVAPAFFQKTMLDVLGTLVGRACAVYIDDIIVFGDTEEEFAKNVQAVLTKLKEKRIVLRGEKCVLAPASNSMEVLGYEVNDKGISLSKARKQGLLEMKKPKTGPGLRSLCGLANYFRPFIPKYATLMKPLTEKVNAKTVEWTPAMLKAFDALMKAVQDMRMLHFVDESAPLILRTDASNEGVGAILFQRVVKDKVVVETPIAFTCLSYEEIEASGDYEGLQGKELRQLQKKAKETEDSYELDKLLFGDEEVGEKPVAFTSKAFNATERKWSTYEQEAYAIFHAVTKLQHYLKGRRFEVETDHKNLTYMALSETPKVVRWRLRLLEFDFSVRHIAGTENVVADALSRCLLTRELQLHKDGVSAMLGETVREVDGDNEELDNSHAAIMRMFHNTFEGHLKVDRMMRKLQEYEIHWPSMKKDCELFVAACPVCQKLARRRKGDQQEIPKSIMEQAAFRKFAIDALGPFPEDEDGNCYILVAVDAFTRIVEAKPCKDASANSAARFLIELLGRYGPPQVLFSDNGKQFTAAVISQLEILLSTESKTTLPYRPQANGQCERVNQEVLKHLKGYVMSEGRLKDMWSIILPLVTRICNYSYHSAIDTFPAKLLYGINVNGGPWLCSNVLPSVTRSTPNGPVPAEPDQRIVALVEAQKELLVKAQARNAECIKKRLAAWKVDEQFKYRPGDFVLVQYPTRPVDKLTPKWRGPLVVVEVVRDNVVKCQSLTETSRMEMLPLDRLKPFIAEGCDPARIAAMDTAEDRIDFIVDHFPKGKVTKKNRHQLQFQVRWDGFTEEHDLWLPYAELKKTEALETYGQQMGLNV
jgi:hypothetical protein